MSERLHQLLDKALSMPGLLEWRMRRFDAAFALRKYSGLCRGVFKTYDEAARAVPATVPLGYDHDGPASMYRDRLQRVWPSDYAMMLWLDMAFRDGATRVFDLGGHVGVSYYAYQKYLSYPPNLSWQVCDVPAVVAEGRRVAAELDSHRRLSFTEEFAAAQGADVLFTSGCLQYLQETLADKLQSLPQRPRWVLVNLLPLHDVLEYWTVQSIGTALCPYRIQRQKTFLANVQSCGYELRDVWENPEKHCRIMFSPEHSLDGYFGAAFRLK